MFRWTKVAKIILILLIGFGLGWFGHAWKYQKQDKPDQMTSVTVVARFSDSNISEYQNVPVTVGSSIVDALKELEQKQLSYKTENKNGTVKVIQLMGVDGDWEGEIDGQMCQISLEKFRLRGGEKIIFINKSATSTKQ